MIFHKFIISITRARSALLIAAVLGLCGCATTGPQSITAGRGVYTDVINSTEDEQIVEKGASTHEQMVNLVHRVVDHTSA